MSITINAPSKFTGTSSIGPLILAFDNGVATYDGDLSDGVRQYLAGAGYGIDEPADPPTVAAAATDLDGKPLDSRDHPDLIEGAPLRDAAVDPMPGDFLPPVNAGQGDPQGPDVVSPGIHAAETKAVVPGPVGATGDDGQVVKDTDAQASKESNFAQATLIDGTPVPAATAAAAQVDPVNEDALAVFDPGAHTVAEVNDYLAQADDAEKVRVFTSELAENGGKERTGILGGPHADTTD